MKKWKVLFLVSLTVLACLILFAKSPEIFPALKSTLTAGTAKINITPHTPIPMSGYGGRNDPFKGIHDSIFARVIVFSDGKNKAALISMETIGVSNTFWKEVTDALEKKAGIKKEFVLLSAVHNHDGPITNVYDESNSPDVLAYIEELKEKIIAATKDATQNMVPVSIGVGKGECKMNINRRAQDGRGEITLGMNPYGPCDHEVGVIRIDDKSGNPISVIMNWPCHGVVLGPKNYLISGDWPGAASGYVEKLFGANFIAPVTIGASGDINPLYGPHIDFESNNDYAFGRDAIGEDLGKESLRVSGELKTFSTAVINASQLVISLPAKPEETEPGKVQQPKSTEIDSLKVRLSVLKIGNIVLAGVSGEVFNEISVKIRKQSPYAFTFMITHCNGSSGYLVTDAAYAEGGYEVNSTRAKSGAEKAIIENLLAMINEL
ncbi:MAG: neutral/alkaline non-lysosomal ceramidase N-terminal domain-containing protein [Ginsengibacter sp.]